MTATQVAPPYPIFTDTSGAPLDAGYVYLGMVNMNPETDPIQVFWDENLSIPAAQPIRTIGGYPSRNGTPAVLYTDGTYSVTVKDKRGAVVFSSPIGYSVSPSSVAASIPIQIVATNIANINQLVGDIANVDIVSQNLGNISTVAGDLEGVWQLGGVYDFGLVIDPSAGNLSPPTGNIATVANDIVNVDIVAVNIGSVVIVATNIAAILAAVASALMRANNLSDLLDVSAARGNLGLGAMATKANVSPSDLVQPFDLGTVP